MEESYRTLKSALEGETGVLGHINRRKVRAVFG